MKNINKLLVSCLMWATVVSAETLVGPSLFFDNNSSKIIRPELFKSYYESIKDQVKMVGITCFADSDGSVKLNQALVAARCERAVEFFRSMGYNVNYDVELQEDSKKGHLIEEKGNTLKDLHGRKALNRQALVFLHLKPQELKVVEKTIVTNKPSKHRTQFYFGFAPDGVRDPMQESSSLFSINEDRDFEAGFSYTYSFSKHFNLSGLVLTNRSFFLGIGKDW